ncbi:nuclear transport factor 2 family protein [Flavobacterium pectinovorum]|jgi:hypothetical protein|uniref:SnoaL-like domain-containing protein n=1 Tax=Flavobacterium pectinovorum TaxID=29533 RepID=A0AB36P5Z3_9FLAO|nr:nuclear transport factor 2 family protein [Flavobacterium pectinovorum]OXB07748.1 hypothetical protein B0A72_02465 [Flavobacterium pectinovorum]SHM79187.1 SnoaL-like domain-containing protein [Flavobacterium pectinovorum]
MTLEILKDKEELRAVIDAYATLGDDKKLTEQMALFTPDTTYNVFMNGHQVVATSGRDQMEKDFAEHIAQVKTYFTLNGQFSVTVDGDTASGVSFSQLKMIRETEGKDVLTDYSVRYEDTFVRQDGKWLIKARIGHFIMIEVREINN